MKIVLNKYKHIYIHLAMDDNTQYTEYLLELTSNDDLHPEGRKIMIDVMKKAVEKKKQLQKVDFEFRKELASRTDRLKLIDVDNINENLIDKGALVLYSENANSYVIYDRECVNNFTQDFGTMFKRNGLIFEVIMDNNPQKLLIIIKHDMLNDHIKQLRQLLLDYICNKGNYTVSPSDIKIFKDNIGSSTNIEIMVNSIIFNTVMEKMVFVEEFKDFLANNADITQEVALVVDKIDYRLPKAYGLDNAKLLKAPFLKTPVNTQKGDDKPEKIFDSLATRITINSTIVVGGDFNNGCVINRNVITKNKTIINSGKKKEVKNPTNFCKYVYEIRPEWYLEGQKVLMSLILDEYQKYSGDYSITDSVLSRKLNAKMFTKSVRTIGVGTFKELFTYDDMKEAVGF
jgi:hypothetical protein